nr:MAG TPA: hypothetical protein [Inoviridae sp.]
MKGFRSQTVGRAPARQTGSGRKPPPLTNRGGAKTKAPKFQKRGADEPNRIFLPFHHR